ncbi:2605_t:CDS:2 [Cetraspora pellucida]|uniref:2605_t:CDS:1 n=1 Tax=Cetraspora pellucida TaxID=1433469 RepID=A0A9N9C2Z5_9GLOM|nr:2605_t:CDS:2 [Cetraspora pellucida]
MQKDEYHHYIPRFILRNFAIDNYERIFTSNRKQFNQNQKFWKTKKKGESLQIYDRDKDQLGISSIARTYGDINMYKDLNHDDTMHVEKKLANLEEKASKVVRDIIEASQINGQIDNRFDIVTESMIKSFMQEHNLENPQEVWLQNVREILDTPHEDVETNLRVFPVDKMDYKMRIIDCFLAIWQAGENDEFIMTTNAFGIFEGINMITPMGPIQHAFHWFYVISPKLLLVLCDFRFREGIGFESLDRFYGSKHRSIFGNVPHPPPIPEYVNISQSKLKPDSESDDTLDWLAKDHWDKQTGIKRQPNDKFTFTFVKVNSATVHLVNSILLNEATPDLQVSVLSLSYLYKTIVKYNKSVKDTSTLQNFSNMKKNFVQSIK